MEGSVTLKVKIRSFPSHGRARVHESVLPMLEAKEGEALLIATYPTVWDEKTKTVAVTGYGDKQVDTSVIMLSPEDVAALGVAEGDTITVMRKVTWTEKISRGAAKAGETIKEGAKGVAEKVHAKEIADTAGKTGEAIKEGATKAGTTIKEGAVKAGESVKEGAQDIAEKVTPKKGGKDL
ncbi:MAG TPA: hypothetical protein HA256_01015 [Methanoregulaceae archaeon]|nr:hypothetical protein [Methanoregulaceae archaeon]